MTNDEMRSLKAGRDLDWLVYKKIFDGRAPHVWYHPPDTLYSQCGSCLGRWVEGTPEPTGCAVIAPFSSELAAAWKIAEKMVKLDDDYDTRINWSGPHYKPSTMYMTQEGFPLGTTCWFVKVEVEGHIYTCTAPTAELAICLAALKQHDSLEDVPPGEARCKSTQEFGPDDDKNILECHRRKGHRGKHSGYGKVW